jgi:hypothetical protein
MLVSQFSLGGYVNILSFLFLLTLTLASFSANADCNLDERVVLQNSPDLEGKPKSYYVDVLKNVFKLSPAIIKKDICELKFTIKDNNGFSAMYMPPSSLYLSAKLFNKVPSIAWGLIRTSNPDMYRNPDPDLETGYKIHVISKYPEMATNVGVVFSYLVHEIGHYEQLKKYPKCWSDLNCDFDQNGYESLMWDGYFSLKDTQIAQLRSKFCNNIVEVCKPSAPLNPVVSHAELLAVGFPTPYAIQTREEDFSENFSFWIYSMVIDQIIIDDGTSQVEILNHYQNKTSPFAKKIEFFEKL